MDTIQRIDVEICFKSASLGGRTTPVNLTTGVYRPHLVPESKQLLGVAFLDATLPVAQPGDTTIATVALMYPVVDYSALSPGAVFEVVEGAQVVAHGKVLPRQMNER